MWVVDGMRDLWILRRGLRVFGPTQPLGRREKVGKLLRALKPAEMRRRRNALAGLVNVSDPLLLEEQKGFALIDAAAFPVAAAADEACRLAAESNIVGRADRHPERPFLADSIARDLTPDSAILRLALDPRILAGVSRYFGVVPIFEDVMIWYSTNQNDLARSSQYYHLDGQDTRTLQLFVHLNDVTETSGPLTFLPAGPSGELARRINYRKLGTSKRVEDSTIAASEFGTQVREMTGPKGSAYIVDTDRCFHFGSRKGSRSRMSLVVQYYTPFAFAFDEKKRSVNPFRHLLEASRFGPIERMVLRG